MSAKTPRLRFVAEYWKPRNIFGRHGRRVFRHHLDAANFCYDKVDDGYETQIFTPFSRTADTGTTVTLCECPDCAANPELVAARLESLAYAKVYAERRHAADAAAAKETK